MDPLSAQIIEAFQSFFRIPEVPGVLVLIGFAIAIFLGAIWIAAYLPPLFKNAWLWVILVASFFSLAFFTAFIQIPLQYASTKICDAFLSRQDMQIYTLVAAIPAMIIAAIVKVGAMLLPVIIFWLKNKKDMKPAVGLFFGLFAATGVTIIESFQINASILGLGWDLSLIRFSGMLAFLPFIERLMIMGFFISSMAIAGYGLAKGKWWQFSLVIAALFFIYNYVAILMGIRVLAPLYAEIIVFILAILTAAAGLWLRWSKCRQPDKTG